MGLSSFFSRPRNSAARNPGEALSDGASSGAVDSVQQARIRARHRLIGSAVLLAIGIVVFPMVFETQPRQVASDIPIEIARRDTTSKPDNRPDAADRRGTGGGNPSAPAAVVAPPPVSEPVNKSSKVIDETAADAGREVSVPPPPRGAAVSRPPAPAAPVVAVKPSKPAALPVKPTPPEPRTATKPAQPPADPNDGGRAQSLLEGKEVQAEAAENTRYVVQVGAFADAAAAREVRTKVERLGLKTYVHVAQTPAGDRTRVRVGPVPTRSEAERMQARLKAAGLSAVVLIL